MDSEKNLLKKMVSSNQFPSIALVIIFFIWDAIMVTGFMRPSSLRYFINVMVPLASITIGVTVTVISGGIDLSTGALVCVVNCAFVVLLEMGYALPAAIFICILIALAVGLVNGFAVAVLRISPLLVTFAMQTICTGLALWIRPIASGSGNPAYLEWYSKGTLFGVPTPLIFFVVLPLLLWYLIKATPLGIWIYAVGKDEKKAFDTGINTTIVQLFVYVFSSFMAGIAAIAFSGNIVGGDPRAGLSFTLNAVAATVVGISTLSGGEGDAVGGLLGAMFINLATYAVLGAGVSTYVEELASGLVIMIGVSGMMAYNIFRKRRLLK